MSDRPDVQTARNIIRAQLAQVFPGNTRLQRAFEDLIGDVTLTLPDSIEAIVDAASAAQATASAALAIATAALARDLEGPPPMPPMPAADDTPPVLNELVARLAQLERDVANMKEGPTP